MSQGEQSRGEPPELYQYQLAEYYDFFSEAEKHIATDRQNQEFKNSFAEARRNFKFAGDANDLDDLVSTAEQAFLNLDDTHPDRNRWLSKLILAMFQRGQANVENAERSGDVDIMISLSKLLIASTANDPNFAHAPALLDILFGIKAVETNNEEDLTAADQRVLNCENTFIPHDSSNMVGPVTMQLFRSQIMFERYMKTRDLGDLDKAIEMLNNADSGDTDTSIFRLHLSKMRAERYERTGSIEDLDEAVNQGRQGVQEIPKDQEGFSRISDRLCQILHQRWRRLARIEDLDLAVQVAEKAWERVPSTEIRRRARCAATLARSLACRSDATQSSEDIDRAIQLIREAIEVLRENSLYEPTHMLDLGSHLHQRYIIRYQPEDLDEAESILIAGAQESAEHGKKVDEVLVRKILDVAFVRERASQFQKLVDFESILSSIFPNRRDDMDLSFSARYTIGISMYLRYLEYDNYQSIQHWMPRKEDILDESLHHLEKSRSLIPEGHLAKPAVLNGIGGVWMERYWGTLSTRHLDVALGYFKEITWTPLARPYLRIHAAHRAIRLTTSAGRFEEAAQIAKEVVEVFPELCSRILSREDQQNAAQVPGFISDACGLSVMNGNVEEALRRAELGRCMTLGYLMDSRSDLTELRSGHPTLAAEYDTLRSRAFQQVDKTEVHGIRDRQAKERHEAARRLEELEEKIRKKPGFQHFMSPLTSQECKDEAADGPIILVNMTSFRSDAIIVTTGNIKHIELKSMRPQNLGSLPHKPSQTSLKPGRGNMDDWLALREEELCERNMVPRTGARIDIAGWLWSTCVKPVLDELPPTTETPRIWWIGMGYASSLPFHAAGMPNSGLEPPQDCLTRAISSYSPTIKALKHSRMRSKAAMPHDLSAVSVMVASMETTPPYGDTLKGVIEEELAIKNIMEKVESRRQPTALEVLNALKRCQIAHFACHGSSDVADPSNSHLLLQGKDGNGGKRDYVDRLTVSALLDSNNTEGTWIAYLSACSTAQTRSPSLRDESIHLGSAFQVAGFGHVIASMWPTDDFVCVKTAEAFYEKLKASLIETPSDRAVAEALRTAVLKIRAERPNDFYAWAPYIHLGA